MTRSHLQCANAETDVLRNVGPALKVKLLERLRDVTQATTDWTKEDVAVMDITKYDRTATAWRERLNDSTDSWRLLASSP